MKQVETGGQAYRVGKIAALEQFHVVRRLAPLLGSLSGLKDELGKLDEADAKAKTSLAFQALPLMSGALAAMSDEDANRCLFGLLRGVERKEPGDLGWSPVVAGDVLAYADIDMPAMLVLAGHSLAVNLGGFFDALPSASAGASPSPSDQSTG